MVHILIIISSCRQAKHKEMGKGKKKNKVSKRDNQKKVSRGSRFSASTMCLFVPRDLRNESCHLTLGLHYGSSASAICTTMIPSLFKKINKVNYIVIVIV